MLNETEQQEHRQEYQRENCQAAAKVDRVLEFIRTQGMSLDDDDETAIVDLLTDIRHWCDEHAQAFAALDRRAHHHYTAEAVEARKGN
ncbi:MAG: hypothetical protein ABSG25_15395 [Bryobacteraceae bacterium]